jgi:hypothetical protein
VTSNWRHRKAETDVEPLMKAAARLDPSLLTTFPRSITDILCAAVSAAFERHSRLTARVVVQVLGDVYGVDHRDLLRDGDGPLAGYSFARGEMAVVFSDPQYGDGFERFTIAHEASHIVVEYLPLLAKSRQPELFGGSGEPALYARRDPPGHMFGGNADQVGSATGVPEGYAELQADRSAWLREVIANACAAELLAPHREVGRYLSSLPADADRTAHMQSRFGLSRRAAEVRLSELGFLQASSDQLGFLS